MKDAAAVLDRLWAEGVSSDDRADIEASRARSIPLRLDDELALFAAWLAADEASTAGIDSSISERLTGDVAAELLILAIELRAAMHRRDHAAMDLALTAIDPRLADAPGYPRRATARAAAEIALAEAALYNQDLETARHCLDPVSASGPTAFRIAALVRHVTVALARPDVETAHTRARQALMLARQEQRPRQTEQAQLLYGLVAYLAGDVEAMRQTLQPLVDEKSGKPVIPLLAAGLAGPTEALARLAGGVQISAERGDAAGYALCALVGARHHVAEGRRPDALLAMSSVRVRLGGHAPQVAAVLDAELLAWRHAWGASAFADAERAAIARLA